MGLNIGVFPGDGDAQNVPEPTFHDNNQIKYVVEVFREQPVAQDVYRGVKEIELVRPGGTVVNIGAGPQLPSNPYEGQVWILT